MATTETQVDGIDRLQSAHGTHIDDAGTTATDIDLGFVPSFIEVENETDRIQFIWRNGMTSAYAVKTIADGTRTLITSAGVTIGADGKSFGFPVITDKQYRWRAHS